MGFLTDIEEWVVEIEIMEYTNCDVTYSMNSLNVVAGENALFTSSYNCESNFDQELDVEVHLVKKNENYESAWESGFNVISEKCTVVISESSGFENCEFELTTPSNIDEKFEGCLIVLDERKLTADSCQNENSLEFIVELRESGLINGVGGNISILDDYNVSEEQVLVASGAFVTLSMLVITALVGTRDLGQEVYIGLTKADIGRGLVAGLCVAFISIIADRIIKAGSNKLKNKYGIK